VITPEDPVSSAKAKMEFAKDNKVCAGKGGYIDGALVSADQIKAIASLPSREELIASNRIEEEVRHKITATTLHHVSIEALIEAIGKDREDLCTGCLTGCYPLAIEGERVKTHLVDFVDATYQAKLESFEIEPSQTIDSGSR
jgi:hypothetical protein